MFVKSKKFLCLLFSLIILFTVFSDISRAEKIKYDLVIKGGNIYNPSTEHVLKDYNIGIIGSKVKKISKSPLEGDMEIDASGLVVSPGFVDLISYDPNHVGIDFKVLDGVTSNLAMHGGTEDATSWYRAWDNNGVITNFGASTFITRLRWPIVGYGVDAEMTEQEDIDELLRVTRENIENGALGISFSFEYVPGIKNEIKPLLELAAEYQVPTFYHLRYSDEERGLEGIQEVIDYGKETGAAIHIMHINSTGGTFVMDQALEMVDQARKDGLDITSCFYPYNYWATYIDSARFRPGWRERFKIDYEDLQIGATDIRITKETFDDYRNEHLLVAAHGSMPEEELIMLLKDPYTMIGSDTIIEQDHNNHPRGAGAYSRVFGKYVREEEVLSIMDAIKKVSYFPAKRMESAAPSMKYKGRIELDSDADITIFDPETIIDKSTVKDPGTASVGVEYVLVNGVLVKDRDGLTNVAKPGKPIMSYFVDQTPDNEAIEFSFKLDEDEIINLDRVYKIEDETYLPLEEIFKEIGFSLKDSKDGKISIGENLEMEIGTSLAILGDEEIKLNDEAIIYKEDIYISLESLKQILNNNYEITSDENDLILNSKKTDNSSPVLIKDSQEDESLDENGEKTDSTSNFPVYLIYGFLILVLLGFYLVFKKKK